MLRYKLLLIFILLFGAGISAQTIYEHSDTSTFVFSYIPYQRSTNNKVLNQLALAHLKVPEKTSFNYTCIPTVKVRFQQNDSLLVMLDIRSLFVTGDNQIRNFDIQNLLVPSRYDVGVSLENPVKGTVFDERKIVVMNDGMIAIKSFPDSLWSDGMQVKIQVYDVSFTEADYRKLELELTAIRDYYASSSLGDTLLKKIQRSRRSTNTLIDAVTLYTTGIKGIYLLNQSLDVTSEIVPGKDPLKVADKNKIIRYNFYEYIDYIIAEKKVSLTGNAYKNFAGAYLQSLREANKLSQQVDYYSSPFYYKLYSNSITSSQLLASWQLLESEVHRRGVKIFDIEKLVNEIFKEYLLESNRLIRDDRYAEAVDLLSGAIKFKKLCPYDLSADNVEHQLAIARKGLIYSYTEIIQKALDKNLLTLAEKYLAEVEKYTAKYAMTNDETGPFKELYLRMADIHVQLGNNALVKSDYAIALGEFTEALDLLKGYVSSLRAKALDGQLIAVRTIYKQYIDHTEKLLMIKDYQNATIELEKGEQFATEYKSFYPDKVVVDSLKHEIAALRYSKLIEVLQANIDNNNNSYDLVSEGQQTQSTVLRSSSIQEATISRLVEATELSLQYHLPDASTLDTLVIRVGIPVINNMFSLGQLKHWAHEPDSALYFAQSAYNLSIKLNVNNYPAIKDQYHKLISLAGETYCNEARGEYASLINQAKELFKDNKFKLALIKTNQARELIYAKATCGLTTAALNKLLIDYQYHIKWDNLISEAFHLLDENNYQASAEHIQQAESVYTFYRLDTFNLANIGYYELAIKTDNIQMLRHAISYHISRGMLDQSFALMEKLRKVGTLALDSYDLQETLARNLAIRDKTETPDLNVKVILESYTAGNDWYDRFENVYRYYTKSPGDPGIIKSIKGIPDKVKGLF